MKKKVLIAVGDPTYSELLTAEFKKENEYFALMPQEVMHYQYLEEILKDDIPDILIVHDFFLPHPKPYGKEREIDWLRFFESIRTRYDDEIRVVFMSKRESNDPFLRQLININILDIFVGNSIDINQFMEQLKDRPRFSRVAKYRASYEDSWEEELPTESTSAEDSKASLPNKEESNDEGEGDKRSNKVSKERKKQERPIIEKVVEKKVINKQVIKRELKFQITNKVEKVVGVPVEKKIILIGSPFQRSGSTFISHLLAESIRELNVPVTYIENPYSKSYTFDRFIGHQRIPDYRSKFYQLSKEVDPKLKSVFDWRYKDIELITKHPNNEPVYTEKDIPFDVFIKLILSTNSTMIIIDVGTSWTMEVFQDLLDIATNTYLVMEPDIVNLQYLEDPQNNEMEYFHELMKDKRTKLIGNRLEKEILANPLIKDLFTDRFVTTFSSFPPDVIFESQYNGEFTKSYIEKFEQKNKKWTGTSIQQSLLPLLEDLLPQHLLKQKKRTIGNLFGKKLEITQT